MISQRRISRGVERPADGEAVKAASVIGKALTKDGKGLGQNNHLNEPVKRGTDLMENNNNTRRTSSMIRSRQTSLKRSPSMNNGIQVRTRSVIKDDSGRKTTNVKRSYSLVVPQRGVTQQDAQSAFDEFGGPQQKGVIHKSPSMSSMPKPTSGKTVKKYVPSARGLIAIEVPVEELQQQKQQAQEQIQRNRSITRSTPRIQSRTNSLTGSRTNSLTGPRSVSLTNSRTSSIKRSTSRTSSLTGSKPNLQPPKRHSSLNSASLGNIPKRNQFMPTPLEEEEEENTRPPVAKKEIKPRRVFSANLPTNTVSTSTIASSTGPSGASEPSGGAKAVRTTVRKVPASRATETNGSFTKKSTNPAAKRIPQRQVSPSHSDPTLENPEQAKNHREVELYEQPENDQNIIPEDEEEEYDDSDKRLWDKKLENVINQDLEDESQRDLSAASSMPSPAQTQDKEGSQETETAVNSPGEATTQSSTSKVLKENEEKENVSVSEERYDRGGKDGNNEGSEPQEDKDEDEKGHEEGQRYLSPEHGEFHDQPEEMPEVPEIQVNDRTKAEAFSQPINEPSQNRLRDYLQGVDEQSEQSGNESVSSGQNANDSVVEPLNTSPRESPTPETDISNNSAEEDQLAKEVRHELDIMGQNGNNENSDENSDELFVDSREDILNDYDNNGNNISDKIPYPPERNPDRQNAIQTQNDVGIAKVPSPIKSALKKTSADNSNSASAFTESSPANQAYLSLTTAENTRLNAQLTGGDSVPRKTVNRSRTMRNSKGAHSLSPPPRDAIVPKRHSHHVGIKTPVERKAAGLPPTRTRNSMTTAPVRNQQPSGGETSNSKNKGKFNNSFLYPREPPQKRSSFEKYRNKNNNIGMGKMSLRDGALLENNYQQSTLGNNFKGTASTPSSAPSSGNESGGSSALFSSVGFKSRFQDSDSEDEGLPYEGDGSKVSQQTHNGFNNGNNNGFSLFKNKNKDESERFGRKLGKLSSKSSNGADQDAEYSAVKKFGGSGFENKTRTLREEIPADDEFGEGGKRNVFGKKLKKLFGRNK